MSILAPPDAVAEYHRRGFIYRKNGAWCCTTHGQPIDFKPNKPPTARCCGMEVTWSAS